MKYYAVHKGHTPGVYDSWDKVICQVNGYSGAVYKVFNSMTEAQEFVITGFRPKEMVSYTATSAAHASASATSHSLDAKISNYFEKMPPSDELYIYTDGSTKNNGKLTSTGGYGVFFSDRLLRPISEPCRRLGVTNNICELTAIIRGVEVVRAGITAATISYSKFTVVTDSEYSYKALTEWIHKWIKNGWIVRNYSSGKTKPVANKQLIEQAYNLLTETGANMIHVYAEHDSKHTDFHSIGNSIADQLSREGENTQTASPRFPAP